MLLHAPLLRLPYFWDEAGYYVPAARDLFLTGTLIPQSTPSNAHPPLVMAWLALAWRVAGYSTLVTRTAMLALTAFSLLGLFRLSRIAANLPVAWATTALVALYPVYFTQSSMAQVDLPAAGFTFWALAAYMEDRPWKQVLWFSLAALAKETAILAPLALFGWELLGYFIRRARDRVRRKFDKRFERNSLDRNSSARGQTHALVLSLLPVVPLAGWYAYHYAKTGFLLGNPEFFRYNVAATLNPLRIPLALGMRLWQLFGYFGLYLLTLAGLLAMLRPPQKNATAGARPRIPFWMQAAFLSVLLAYLGLHVGRGRSGAGSLHVAGGPAGNPGVGLDSLAARALLEIDCGSGRDCICRGPVQQSALWIHSRRQSGLSRLHRDARGSQSLPGDAISRRARSHRMARVGRTHPAMARLY